MYKINIIIRILFIILIFSNFLYSESNKNYFSSFWVSCGYKDNITASVGLKYSFIGLELGLAAGDYPGDALGYPCPHEDYFLFDKKNSGTATGLDILGFYDFNDHFALYFGFGFYDRSYYQISMSNITGLYYEQNYNSKNSNEYCIGFQNLPLRDNLFARFLVWGLSYHTLRGINLIVGLGF